MAISGNSKIPGYMIEGMAAGGYRAAKRLINKYNNSGDAKEIAMEGITGMGGKPTGVTSVDDDLASLNPISKPGTTPWQVDDYNKSKNWTKPGVRVPELNPNLEYEGDLTIKPIATKEKVTANRMTAVRAPKPPVNLNIGGPKEVPGMETGWIQQNDRLEYRPEVSADKKTRRKTKKAGLRRRKQDMLKERVASVKNTRY